MSLFFTSFFFKLICLSSLYAPEQIPQEDLQEVLPQVFMIGEYETDYEQIMSSCDEMLLKVCEDSMDDAYKNWLLLLRDMEVYAEEEGFDIKGIKIWLNVFWNADGSINHMVYYPKPNSRNMDFSLLSDFLNSFASFHKSSINHAVCFSHYGSGSFPTFADYYLKEK